MNQPELAERLVVVAGDAVRAELLERYAALADVELARLLKDICLDGWTADPARATRAAAALNILANLIDADEVAALAAWGAGIAALIDARMEQAIMRLDESEARFVVAGKPHEAALTQVSKVIALAMLGRYAQAIECGLRAREVLDAFGDALAAGVIEQNIGNIYMRRDRHHEAEQYQLAARERFTTLDDHKRLAQIDNCLAITHTFLHKFRSAEQLYEQALRRAGQAGLSVTQAEIEASMGNLALFQGRYDRALDYLERSRRRFASLGMAHQSAIAEQELADAYLELNLAPEAAAIYERVVPVFDRLGMRAEQARSCAHHGRALMLLGQWEKAQRWLGQARKLYAGEGNPVGVAMVTLAEAQLHYAQGDYAATLAEAAQAGASLAESGAWRRLLMSRWLHGEAARKLGDDATARRVLEETLRDAETHTQPQLAQMCLTSLGLLAAAMRDAQQAEDFFKRAVTLIEELRAPLPAEELRTAFVADKLTPYDELMRLCLDDDTPARTTEALGYVEQARSRALVDMLGGTLGFRAKPRDQFEARLLSRLEELREELNWFYSQLNRPPVGDANRLTNAALTTLNEAVRERESSVLEILRQLQLRGQDAPHRSAPLDFAELQNSLGETTALVEYAALDGRLLAFVVTGDGVEVVRDLGSETAASDALSQLRFQLGALRHGSERVRRHLAPLTARTRHHLGSLYDILLRPLEARLGARRLVVVPFRALHYVPFHALFDGAAHVVERREVCYAPSAGVLRHCLAQPRRTLESALLLGVADEQTPRVRDEIDALAPLFPQSIALLDERATLDALRRHAPAADVLHLACHGQFRPDNPLFSSLRLADGWLTVRDAYDLDLNCGLVTLSACETGMSAVAPGDELLGLARGFLSAGATSLLLSLWTVDDAATARLMTSFYTRIRAGESPAAALRQAQLALMQQHPHPFFWSPFVLVGRW